MNFQNTLAFAKKLDKQDELKHFRDRFYIPKSGGKELIYFCGNSLGLQPKTARAAIEQELQDWQEYAVEGHFKSRNPWFYYHHIFSEPLGKLVGAKPAEVVVMNTLTTNLHLMLVSFYRPTKERYKILIESPAFPSDYYAVESQVRFHSYDPASAIVEVVPRAGELIIRTEDIEQAIADHANELALVMIGGVNYYTGQVFDFEAITKAGHKAGALVGFDLAHAAGNIPLQLHDWNVDFAVWCTYKYLNSGPGGPGGAFVHETHATDSSLPRFAGWWGQNEQTRFKMEKVFSPMAGAAGWQLSNAQVFSKAIHKASLDIFAEAGIENLRKKSLLLTEYLLFLLEEINNTDTNKLNVITPKDKSCRGSQLSIIPAENGKAIFDELTEKGVIADWREPDVIRIAPVPLYNTFKEVYQFAEILKKAAR